MQALVARTQAAKQDAQQTQVQLDASTELLDKKVQEITNLRVSFCAARATLLHARHEHHPYVSLLHV